MKKMKLSLENLTDFLSKLAEKSESVYWLSSADFKRIAYISPAYDKIWGRPREELYDNPELWIKYLLPEDAREYHPIHAMADRIKQIGDRARYDESYRILRPDGETRWIIDRGFPVFGEDGECYGVTGVAIDVTREKLTEEAMRIAKEKAEAANRVKSEFLAMVSHDLRTPLNGILGMAQILARKSPRDDQRVYINDLYQAGQVLLSLISDLLDFSKLEAGKLELISKPFDFRELVQYTVASLSILAKEKNLELVIDYKEHVPTHIIGDVRRIRQIITNLLGNAIKFTEEGHIVVAVTCLEENDDRALLRLSVKDTGIGIPADKLDFVFERFNQIEPSYRSRQNTGTGLGLSIVKQMVEAMGGQVGVESQLHKGTEFFCEIPVPLQSKTPTAETAFSREYADMRVLVVDDNLETGSILCKHVNTPGSQAVTSEMALEALVDAYEQGNPYQIVIIDDRISFMDAIAFGKTIHLQPKFKDPVLVLLSRPGPFSKREKAKSAGYYDLLIKPIKPTELSKLLAKAWEERTDKKKQQGSERTNQLRALLVEDNPLSQKIARIMLEELGCHVLLADSGSNAIGLLNYQYDIVFMDVNLGDMDGYAVTEEIRRREAHSRRVPVIAMTANAFESDRQKCLDSGMDDVLIKPVNYDELREMIERWTS